MIFSAHIDKNGNIQTVLEHSANVSILASKYGHDIGVGNIGKLAGLIHDIGKLTKEFDDYIHGHSSAKRGDIDHSYAGAKYICELADKLDKKRFYNVSRFIARLIISHHGLHDWIDENCRDYFGQRMSEDMFYDQVRKNINLMIDEDQLFSLLDKADTEYRAIREDIVNLSKKDGKLNKTECAFYLGLFERMMQSVLVDADRTDTTDFMAGEKLGINIDTTVLWDSMYQKMMDRIKGFSTKTDDISVQRMSISDRCAAFADHNVGICRLIVPTGGGKTLSSLRFAIDYCKKYSKRKIIYVAPYMSILEQNSDELKTIAGERAFTEHHSDASADIDSAEELHEYELRTERWDAPVIATTMVQFLNTLFSAKMTSVRRMHTLCNSVIILDEIQSIPNKCVHMFNLAMNFLSAICKNTVVLCSATQPPLEDMRYSLHLDKCSSMTGNYDDDFKVFKRTEIVPVITEYGMDYDEATEFCLKKFQSAGNMLVIVNTKSAAKNMYERLKDMIGGSADIIHLSTNMCPEHRRDCIRYLRDCLDKHKLVVCVTTQLIEAGVDISFKCVVRSMAGLGNVAQAAGRCNRHGEETEKCPVYLIKLKDESLKGLIDIKNSQTASLQIMYRNKDIDIQSPEILREYFEALYGIEKNTLSYNVTDNGVQTTLLDLMALNSNRYEMSPKSESPYASQAFKTAGSFFEVIDNSAINVIVPYNDDARTLIEMLDSDFYDPALMRKAQKYLIGLYSGTQKKLIEEHALRSLKSGIYALRKEYYDEATGLKTEGAMQELLIF